MQQKILDNRRARKLRVQQDAREEVAQALSSRFEERGAEFRCGKGQVSQKSGMPRGGEGVGGERTNDTFGGEGGEGGGGAREGHFELVAEGDEVGVAAADDELGALRGVGVSYCWCSG